MSTPPSRSIITYPWTKKTMLFIFMMNLGKVRYIFVFITLPGRAVSFLERVAMVDMIFIIYCKNITRMMDVILYNEIGDAPPRPPPQ